MRFVDTIVEFFGSLLAFLCECGFKTTELRASMGAVNMHVGLQLSHHHKALTE